MSEVQITNIRELSPPEWWDSDCYESVRFHFLTSSYRALSKLEILGDLAKVSQKISLHPTYIKFLDFLEPFEWDGIDLIAGYKDDSEYLSARGGKKTIDVGSYVVISSPVDKIDTGTNEKNCNDSIETMRGFLCATFGGSIANMTAAIIDINLKNPSQISSTTNRIERMPHPLGYLICEPQSIRKFYEYVDAEKDPLWLNRLQTALLLFGRSRRSVDSRFRFFDKWTALEVYVGGPSKLAGLIDKSHESPIWRAKMKELKNRRDDLVHKGERYNLSQEDERIIAASIMAKIFERAKIYDQYLRSVVNI